LGYMSDLYHESGIFSLQNYRACRRSLGVVYLDLELPGRLEQAYWDILESSAACQLDRITVHDSLPLVSDRSYRHILLAQVGRLLVSTVAWRDVKGLTRLGLFSDRLVKYFLIIFSHPLLPVRRKLLSD
jgi:hypothetical protein